MQILPASPEALKKAVEIIRSGGIVAHATETCYGLASDLTNEDAVQKLFALKQRPEGMPVSALFASIEKAKEWVEWNEKAEELFQKYLPGPLTIVLPLRSSVVGALHATPLQVGGTIGFRISSHPIAQKLAELCSAPLSTTSANLHGSPETYSAEEVATQLQPDLILDSGKLSETGPSTVVAIEGEETRVLRQGTVKI